MYGKVFEAIFDSSLIGRGGYLPTYIFMSMIAIADENGVVSVSSAALYSKLALDREGCIDGTAPVDFDAFLAALQFLESPDDESETPTLEGRRIVPLKQIEEFDSNRGWLIVNYQKYRDMARRREQTASAANRAQQYRDRKRDATVTTRDASHPVTRASRTFAHTDTDTDTDTDKSKPPLPPQGGLGGGSSSGENLFDAFWSVVHRREGKAASQKAFDKAIRAITHNGDKTRLQAAQWLVERMRSFAGSSQAKDEVRGKIHPATWLNQGRYDDDDALWRLDAPEPKGSPPPMNSTTKRMILGKSGKFKPKDVNDWSDQRVDEEYDKLHSSKGLS